MGQPLERPLRLPAEGRVRWSVQPNRRLAGSAGRPPRGEALRRAPAQQSSDDRSSAIAQRELADAVSNSPRVLSQQASLRAVLGPGVIAQAKRLYGAFGNAFAQLHASGPTVQRWPATLPIEGPATRAFASLADYFRHLAGIQRDAAKPVALALLKELFLWRSPDFSKPFELEDSEIDQAKQAQTRLDISKGDWSGLVFEGRTRVMDSPRQTPLKRASVPTNLLSDQIIPLVKQRIIDANDDFALLYDDPQLRDLVTFAAGLGLDAKECEEVILIGCRKAKPRSAEQLKNPVHNLKGVIAERGYPFKFQDIGEFQTFRRRLKEEVGNLTLFKTKIPHDDIRVQGSSLRTLLAEDVDIAVMVSEDIFKALCLNRYSKVKRKQLPNVDLQSKSYQDLRGFAELKDKQVWGPKTDGEKLAYMLAGGKFDGKTQSSDRALVTLTKTISDEFKSLNIESVTILVIGGPFDLKPFVKL